MGYKRRPMSRGKSKKVFRRSANSGVAINMLPRSMRGGTRL